tara:strand:+ start:5863 stop:6663 length:801 start_codon:yes stop_codon:yes gene_type:complete
MATSRMARRNLARQNLNTARKDAKGKLVASGLNEISGLVEFGLEATAGNRSAYDAFEKGAEELGIEMDSGSGVMGKVKNFMARNFTSPDKMMNKEFYSDDSRVYTGADISFIGRMKSSKDEQVQMLLANETTRVGKSLSEAFNIGQDIEGGMSESDIKFKADKAIERRGTGGFGQTPSIASMDTGTGVLSDIAGIESSVGKRDFDSSKFALELATGPQGQPLEKNSKGQYIYKLDPNDPNSAYDVVAPGTRAYDLLGLGTKELGSE